MGTVPGPRAGEGAGRNDLPLLLLLPFPAGNLILGLCEMVKGKRQIEGGQASLWVTPRWARKGFRDQGAKDSGYALLHVPPDPGAPGKTPMLGDARGPTKSPRPGGEGSSVLGRQSGTQPLAPWGQG